MVNYIINNNHVPSLFIVVSCNIVSGFGCGFLPVGFAMVRECNDYYNWGDAATWMVNMVGKATGFMAQLMVSNLLDYNWKQRGGNDYKIMTIENIRLKTMILVLLLFQFHLLVHCFVSLIVKETYDQQKTKQSEPI